MKLKSIVGAALSAVVFGCICGRARTVVRAPSEGCPTGAFTFITPDADWKFGEEHAAAFARTLPPSGPVACVTAYATALGCYELYLNGKLVSTFDGDTENRDDYLRPGLTDTRKRRVYSAYDVTALWKNGTENTLAAFVAGSWYNDCIGGCTNAAPSFALKLNVEYADGTAEVVETDGEWTASFDTPFTRAAIYGGEHYDARKADCPCRLAGTRKAKISRGFTGEVTPYQGAGVSLRRDLTLPIAEAWVWDSVEGAASNVFGKVVRKREYRAGETIELDPGETLVVDFAQNAAAIPEIVACADAGVTLTFKGGEMLNDANGERERGNDGPAGSLYRENLRSLKDENGALVKYTFAGTGDEKYLPSFTFMGYRYASIVATGHITIRSLVSIPVTSIAKSHERGTIRTGVADVNRLIENCRWGQYSNYLSVPTDCPQRDERQGWAADTQVFTAAAFRNADVYDFLTKWMTDMRDLQDENGSFPSVAPNCRWGACGYSRLGWSDAGVIVPWTCWRMTGRKDILLENWAAMKAFLALQDKTQYKTTDGFQYGDWVSYEQITPSGIWAEGHAWDPKYVTPEAQKYWDYLGGCYWYWNATRMVEMAEALGFANEAKSYAEMASRAHGYLRDGFFGKNGQLIDIFSHLQTPTLFALHLGLYNSNAARKIAAKNLLSNFSEHGDCLQTGFLGTSILMDALTYGADAPEMAYTLLLQHKNPSWLYSVDQGATTIWERWNSYVKDEGFGDVGMNSFNHYAYGCVLDWLYGTMAGIRPGEKGGFDNFELRPIPDPRLGFVEATYRNSHGVIRSSWKYVDGKCLFKFTVPKKSRAWVTARGIRTPFGPGTYTIEL